jgi:hypothetical protein
MVNFFSQGDRARSAVVRNFQSKKRAKGHEVQAPFSAKFGHKKSP